MSVNSRQQKVRIEYPCRWVYKVIGPDRGRIRQAIDDVAQDRERIVSPSNSSRTGKYHCLDIELTVFSEEDRASIHFALKRHPDVTMVL